MNYLYEVVRYNKNIPAMILMQNKPGYRCRTNLHWHKELELVYMIKGYLDVCINGKQKTIDDNELYFVNSEVIHVTDIEDDNKINIYLVVLLSYEFMRQFFPDIDSIVFDVDTNKEAKANIISSMQNIVKHCENSNDIFGDIKKYEEILKIYYELLKHCAVYKKNNFVIKTPRNFGHAKKVIEYVGKHYTDEITLNDMAELAELSPAYFSKYFKDITGTSFCKYLNGIRLEHALKDMITQNMSVTDAAFNNGFPNVKSFITLCKKVYGYTPAQYRIHHNEY